MTTPTPINPFAGLDARSLIDRQAAARGDHPCLIREPFEGEGRAWSYARFAEALRRVSAEQPVAKCPAHRQRQADKLLFATHRRDSRDRRLPTSLRGRKVSRMSPV